MAQGRQYNCNKRARQAAITGFMYDSHCSHGSAAGSVFKSFELKYSQLTAICTDGDPAMVGLQRGFIA